MKIWPPIYFLADRGPDPLHFIKRSQLCRFSVTKVNICKLHVIYKYNSSWK